MPIIIIAYSLIKIEEKTVRIYDDSTEKYFSSYDNQDAKDYLSYLTGTLGLSVEHSEIVINDEGDVNVMGMIRQHALSKLSQKEKEALGVS